MTEVIHLHIADYPNKDDIDTGCYRLYYQDPLLKKKVGFTSSYGKRKSKEDALVHIHKKKESVLKVIEEVTQMYQDKIKNIQRMK
jgi:hypothetical protein